MLNELKRTSLARQLLSDCVAVSMNNILDCTLSSVHFRGQRHAQDIWEQRICEGLMAVLQNIQVFWDVSLRLLLKQRDIP
jgi:hypothetical protein